ncbi:enhanced intracellular survival protein Eis [Micromonospora sp. NPDC051925]|uniref:enhanced intracellular survival protein Eis n=1 Tax=Micromonospora sp. NPDC051925 TaxID=3364288 RepID=UPI0037CC0C78
MHSATHIRELTDDDATDAWRLGRTAFGSDPQPPPQTTTPTPGTTRYGAFDHTGRLIGKAIDLHHDQWWDGRAIAAADIAGVAVAPETRGRGVARALLTTLLRGAHDRGAAISALFPTVAAPYRACGWEIAGTRRTVDLPTALLTPHRPSPHLTVRPGSPDDLPAVDDLYAHTARHRRGLLTRRGTLFDHHRARHTADHTLPYDGLTLVEHRGHLVGYAAWNRRHGYGADGTLTIEDLAATTGDAARELVGILASWRSVAPTLRLTLLPGDAVTAHLPVEKAREHHQDTWMHRPVDVTHAVRDRGWPAHVHGTTTFTLDDPLADWNTGTWHLEITDGTADLRRTTADTDLHLTIRGFALLYTGAATARTLAQAGLLHHPAGTDPAPLDLLAAAGPAQLGDYF